MCGEKQRAGGKRQGLRGLPPHVRGKGILETGLRKLVGITPAYAGKKPWALRRPGGRRDHPRMCGEKYWRL